MNASCEGGTLFHNLTTTSLMNGPLSLPVFLVTHPGQMPEPHVKTQD